MEAIDQNLRNDVESLEAVEKKRGTAEKRLETADKESKAANLEYQAGFKRVEDGELENSELVPLNKKLMAAQDEFKRANEEVKALRLKQAEIKGGVNDLLIKKSNACARNPKKCAAGIVVGDVGVSYLFSGLSDGRGHKNWKTSVGMRPAIEEPERLARVRAASMISVPFLAVQAAYRVALFANCSFSSTSGNISAQYMHDGGPAHWS